MNTNTLIPRPETEELVAWILEEVGKTRSEFIEGLKVKKQAVSILDIGTGTGCIPISLAKNIKNTTIAAIDISEKALEIATQNATLNNVKVDFFKQDILKTDNLNEILKPVQHKPVKYNIIVSNPPYVRDLEKLKIKNNVLNNEPHLALFVSNENPLIFYDKITNLAQKYLKKKGLLFFEINQYLGRETVTLLKEKGFKNIELRKDVFGNDRMIKASL